MDDIFVGRLMSSPVRTIEADATVQQAASIMSDHGVGSVVAVDEGGDLAGIMTGTDFVQIVLAGRPADEALVSEFMTRDVVTTTVNEPITDVATAMVDHDIHHVPVVDDVDGVVGMLTTKDLTEYLSGIQTRRSASR